VPAEIIACVLVSIALAAIFGIIWLLSRRNPGVSAREQDLRAERENAIKALKRAKTPWTRFVGLLQWGSAMALSLRSGVPWIVGGVFIAMASAVCGSPWIDFFQRVLDVLERWLHALKGQPTA
jgi:hypothetical protein